VLNGSVFTNAADVTTQGLRTQISLNSGSINTVELSGDGTATVSGELTIRGVSHAVSADGTYQPPTVDPFGTQRAGLELRVTVDRRDWGMTWQAPLPDGGDALGWDVEITASLEFVRKD